MDGQVEQLTQDNSENKLFDLDQDAWYSKIIQKGVDWISKISPELGDKITSVLGWSTEQRVMLANEVESNEQVQNYVEMASALDVNVDNKIKSRLNKLGQPFIGKLKMICDRNSWNPNDLLRVLNAESALDPGATNASGATGLLQVMPKVAGELGTSTSAIAKMTALQQLDVVEKYFQHKSYGKSLNSTYDMYAVTFFPRAIGRGPNYVFSSPRENLSAKIITEQNPVIAKFSNRPDGLIDGRAFEEYVNSIT